MGILRRLDVPASSPPLAQVTNARDARQLPIGVESQWVSLRKGFGPLGLLFSARIAAPRSASPNVKGSRCAESDCFREAIFRLTFFRTYQITVTNKAA